MPAVSSAPTTPRPHGAGRGVRVHRHADAVLQRRRRPRRLDRGDLQQHPQRHRRGLCGDPGGRLRHLPRPDHRPPDAGHVPHRLADGLPVDRELPGAAVRDGRFGERRRLHQPRVRRQARRGRLGADCRGGDRALPGSRAHLADDMPSIPMWYGKTIAGHSSNVDNVKITPFGTTDLLSISLAE